MAALLLALSGCDTTSPSTHVAEPVVEVYLVAGKLLPPVRLSWTQDINEPYSTSDLAIAGAAVSIQLLDAQGLVETTIRYLDGSERGVYAAIRAGPAYGRVKPGRDYRLQVTLEDGTEVTSQTHVPGGFDFLGQNAQALEYQATEQLETRVTPSAYPGRGSIFVFTIEALEPQIENLTAFYLQFMYEVDPEDDLSELDLADLEEVRISSSPPLNEANYQAGEDGSITIPLPWFAIAFYGVNRIGVNAIDNNIDQYMRFQQAQQGGSLAPGEIPNVIDAVEGGRGVFGSMTRISVDLDVTRAAGSQARKAWLGDW